MQRKIRSRREVKNRKAGDGAEGGGGGIRIDSLGLPEFFIKKYGKHGTLSPVQEKAIKAGIMEGRSMLVCAPTASGKTLVGSMALTKTLGTGKGLYVVPLKALAAEKFAEFKELCEGTEWRVAMATGDVDEDANISRMKYIEKSDIIILTSEKLDLLLRERKEWLTRIKVVVIDEIHLIHDPSRGPTLEVVITLLKMLMSPQIVGLSATIGNPEELASWLEGELVMDNWRPVRLEQGIFYDGKVNYY